MRSAAAAGAQRAHGVSRELFSKLSQRRGTIALARDCPREGEKPDQSTAACLLLPSCVHPTPTPQSSAVAPSAPRCWARSACTTPTRRARHAAISGPDGAYSTCYITPDLKTVVARRDPTSGQWSAPTTLAPLTSADKFHNQCSLGMDLHGHLHAAANMHATPWQYWVSSQPHSVAQMVFRGQPAGNNRGARPRRKATAPARVKPTGTRTSPALPPSPAIR